MNKEEALEKIAEIRARKGGDLDRDEINIVSCYQAFDPMTPKDAIAYLSEHQMKSYNDSMAWSAPENQLIHTVQMYLNAYGNKYPKEAEA